jgi:hypothetical protein
VQYGSYLWRVGCVIDRREGGGEVTKAGVRAHPARILVAGFGALVLAFVLLGSPAGSRGAAAAGSPSNNVAVVPGFAPPSYPGNQSVPPLTTVLKLPMYSQYHFTQLGASAVTTAALKNYDTVILYGIRWSDIPSAGQTAINAFAATRKVIIWDADATGAQTYSTFVHPFSTLASGQKQASKSRASVVYFLQHGDFLASSDPQSPSYLNATQLVGDPDEVNDMNAMKTATPNWRPALLAANDVIRNAAWPIAWSYGVIGDHTGMTIYSGLDADAFPTNPGSKNINNDRQELALDLAKTFRSTPDTSCSPHCSLGSSPVSNPFAPCQIAKPSPHWPHGHLPLAVETSDAAEVSAQIVTHSGRVLATAPEAGGLAPLVIPTAKLPNGTSRLRARVLVHGAKACTNPFQLSKVNNGRLRLLLLATSHDPIVHAPHQADLLTLRASETSSLTIVGQRSHWRLTRRIPAHKIVQFKLPVRVRKAKLTLRDRAGNTVTRSVGWG